MSIEQTYRVSDALLRSSGQYGWNDPDEGSWDVVLDQLESTDDGVPLRDEEGSEPFARAFWVAQEGGGEGSGEYVYLVIKVEFEDGAVQHYRIEGSYQSFGDGTTWDGDLHKVDIEYRWTPFYVRTK